MKLLVVRHGRTDWNDLNKIQGIHDTNLNETGISQAYKTKELLKDNKIDVVISSPLKRTMQTAEIITEGRDLQIIKEEGLKERDFGEYEGFHREDFEYADFWTYSKNIKYKSAENIQDFFARVFKSLDDIKEKYQDKNVLIVIHGGVSVAVEAYFNGLPKENEPTKGALKNCEVKEYTL